MLPQVSKGFRAIFVAVMCVVCVALCVLAVRLGQQGEQLRLTQLQLDASLARLKLQQTQRAQIDVDLPETLAQLQAVQPEDAASAREQELRAQRKAIRSENAELAAQAETLTQQLALLRTPDSELIGEVETLQKTLSSLQAQVDAARQLLGQAEE